MAVNEASAGSESAPTQPASPGPEAAPSPEPAAPPPAPPRESGLSRFLRAVFSPQTRLGRIVRPTLRWTGFVVAFFALGVLAAYIKLYRPASELLALSQSRLQETRAQLATANADLANTRTELESTQAQLKQTLSAQERLQARLSLLKVLNHVLSARITLYGRNGVEAQKSLEAAQGALEEVLPQMRAADETTAEQLKTRLALALSELNDPQTAQADLTILTGKLLEAEKLFTDMP